MKSIVNSAISLILATSPCSLAAGLTSGQTHTHNQQKADKQSGNRQSKAEILTKKIDEKIRRDNEQEEKFMLDFLSLPPRERVKLWREGRDVSGRGLIPRRMESALIARGVDAAPYLAEVVRKGNSYYRVYALKILCDIDRFVPVGEMAMPEFGVEVYVKQLNIVGRLNPFMIVDGRRMGKDGYEVVRWAAEQTKDKDLRFHARLYSGLLEQDLRNLSLDEQIKHWREAVIKSKGILGLDMDAINLSHILKGVLVAQAPKSIPPLIAILDKVTRRYNTTPEIQVVKVIPEMRQFVTYLTQVDPFFPSWEYTYIGNDEVMHPRYKQKVARYYEQWKRFKGME